ncbi:MAG: hypothetical protein ACPGVC_04885 [Salibacteraceae bacterium]
MRILRIAIILVIAMSLSKAGFTQETNDKNSNSETLQGVAKTGSIKMTFTDITYKGLKVEGSLKPNVTMTKYTLDFHGEGFELSGEVLVKELKRVLHLNYNGQEITGEIKHPALGIHNHPWNVNFLGSELKGAVSFNATYNKATFDVASEYYKIAGFIKDKDLSIDYGLTINNKSINGVIKRKLIEKIEYNLELDHLIQEEFGLFLLIETIRLIEMDQMDNSLDQNDW